MESTETQPFNMMPVSYLADIAQVRELSVRTLPDSAEYVSMLLTSDVGAAASILQI